MNKAILFILIACCFSCAQDKDSKGEDVKEEYTSFQEEVAFMRKHTEILVLEDESGQSKLAISPALQGRVMTSSSQGSAGRSYGWINKELFSSGDTLEHINVYGGEERFWLGPEGGQFSIFFTKGDEFTLEDWQTPRLIDLDPFLTVENSISHARFIKAASIKNYSGFTFYTNIDRNIKLLSKAELAEDLGLLGLPGKLHSIGYRSVNTLTNIDSTPWTKETGLLSIWLLGMFNPSPNTSIIIPFEKGNDEALGAKVNDAYFGKVPKERLVVEEDVLFFKGDGQYRSKIGLSPARSKNVLGSYDAQNQILTIVKYNKPEGIKDYVNSLWEIQEAPYAGDVVNSYNDGPPEPGKKPLGPFYELETSSPAWALKPGESFTHTQLTAHFEGNIKELNKISHKLLGVSLAQIASAFE